MRIVVVGAGFTGVQLAKLLINEKNQVVLIDNDEETIRHASNKLDCTVICADGNNLSVLQDVGIEKADALICVTASDEVNMITCSLVDAVYPNILKIARVRNYAYYLNSEEVHKKYNLENSFSEKTRPLYGINYMIHPDVEAAEAIVRSVENGAIGNVLSFDNSDLQIARIVVNKNSSIEGISLKQIRNKTDIKFLVIYVEKDGVTSLPSGETLIKEGNVLGVLLDKKEIPAVMELCGSVQKDLKKIVLVGAGRIGSIIAERLIKKKESKFSRIIHGIKNRRAQDFVIIDSDDELTKIASERFPEAHILKADASDEYILREEGIVNFDLAICATHNHELNMVLAAYMESLGVRQSISLVKSADFSSIAENYLGIDVAIPLRDCVVDSIMSHLRGKAVKEIHTVSTGDLEIVECEVTPSSKVIGQNLKDISNPGNFLVLLTKKSNGSEYEIADGNTKIDSGDNVVLISKAENSKKILSYFAGKE